MKTLIAGSLLALTAIAPAVHGQPGPPARPPMDAVSRHLVPPDAVMAHQAELGVTEAQRERFQQIMSRFQSEVVELQWRQQAESTELGKLLETAPVDETAALEQLDRLISVEDGIKRLHFSMLIRLKNELTLEQLQRLRELGAPGR